MYEITAQLDPELEEMCVECRVKAQDNKRIGQCAYARCDKDQQTAPDGMNLGMCEDHTKRGHKILGFKQPATTDQETH